MLTTALSTLAVQTLPGAFVVMRRIYVEKEMLCAGQIGKLTKGHPTRSDLCQQGARFVFALGDQLDGGG